MRKGDKQPKRRDKTSLYLSDKTKRLLAQLQEQLNFTTQQATVVYCITRVAKLEGIEFPKGDE